MEEDAFDFISLFTKKMDAVKKQKYRRKGDKYDMCGAIKGMIETGKREGREEGRIEGRMEEQPSCDANL